MTRTVKKASIIIMAVVFIATICMPIAILPSKVYADGVPYVIGDTGPAGGKIFYDKGNDIGGWRYLEVSLEDPGLNPRWHHTETFIGGTSAAIGSGMANTLKILALPDLDFNAANWCAGLSVSNNGVIYDDWFLPSFDELRAMFANLDYNFQDWPYWSSTEEDAWMAWWVYEDASDNISSGTWYKNESGNRAAAIRAFSAVQPSPVIQPSQTISKAEEQEEVWIRNHEMTCFQVWINEDNNFEFVFWWEYANNNWVKIYDIEGNEVFSTDMPYGNARFIADLPDGFYTVKTFHDGFETPIQEFLIGKP